MKKKKLEVTLMEKYVKILKDEAKKDGVIMTCCYYDRITKFERLSPFTCSLVAMEKHEKAVNQDA